MCVKRRSSLVCVFSIKHSLRAFNLVWFRSDAVSLRGDLEHKSATPSSFFETARSPLNVAFSSCGGIFSLLTLTRGKGGKVSKIETKIMGLFFLSFYCFLFICSIKCHYDFSMKIWWLGKIRLGFPNFVGWKTSSLLSSLLSEVFEQVSLDNLNWLGAIWRFKFSPRILF